MRSSPLIEYSSTVLILCLWIGAITSVFSSLIGLFQQDIKKIIAYSTMSQLAQIYNKILFIIHRIQAVCVEVILLCMNNSQVTKAHDYLNNNHISKKFNSHLSQYFYILSFIISISEPRRPITIRRLVGTSETIRLILILISLSVPLIIYNSWTTFSPYHGGSWFYLIFFINFLLHIILIFYLNLPYLNLYKKCTALAPSPQSGKEERPYGFFLIAGQYCPRAYARPSGQYKKKGRGAWVGGAGLGEGNRIKSIFLSNAIGKIRRYYSISVTPESDPFFEWLAGVIDGVGDFSLTKKDIARLTIIMNIRDRKALYDIKHKFGGSIRSISKSNALKYQISHKKGLIALLEAVNGLIRNPSKLLQMNKLCEKYNIKLLYPKPLTFNNGWLSGFIDSEGSVCFNEESEQVFISINQKNKYLLDPLQILYGGRIKIKNSKTEAFNYIIYRKVELFNLIDNYFNKYPLRTKKLNRIELIKEFYLKIISRNNKDINKLNEWVKFKDKWEKYQD